MLKRALHYLTLSLVGLLMVGCASVSTSDSYPVPPNAPVPFPGFTFPLLDLANGQIPLPNDLLNPIGQAKNMFPGTGEPFDAINSLDGFSTSAPIYVPFRGPVKANSVSADTLPVYNLATNQRVLATYTVTQGTTGSTVIIVPVHALDPSTPHLVIVTSGVISDLSDSPVISDNTINLLKRTDELVDSNGVSTIPGVTDAQAALLEPVRVSYQQIWGNAERLTGQTRSNIPLAFRFTTQRLHMDLPNARTNVVGVNAPAMNANPNFPAVPAAEFAPVAAGHTGGPNLTGLGVPTVEQFFAMLPAPANGAPNSNIGRIHFGTVQAPIYRNDRENGFWGNPATQLGSQTVPFVLFLPNSVAIPDLANQPVPVAIFQHGITGNKLQSVVLADAFNSQGIALIAIDLELHGDLKQPAAADGDGFVNLTNLRNGRDNIRQSVVNLYALNQAITSGQTNIDGVGAPELGAPNVNAAFPNPFYISLSLGSIVGDIFVATEPNISRAALNVGGARISNLLLESNTFGPIVRQGLAAQGIVEGTPEFAQFWLIAQTVIDDADPVNYADHAVTGDLRGNTPASILQQANTTDAVVPPVAQYDLAIQHGNGVSNPAFTQLDAIVAQLGLIAQGATPFTGSGLYEIPNAGHGALLDPTAGPTTQIVTQALTYFGTGSIVDTGIRPRTAEIFGDSEEDLARYGRAIKF